MEEMNKSELRKPPGIGNKLYEMKLWHFYKNLKKETKDNVLRQSAVYNCKSMSQMRASFSNIKNILSLVFAKKTADCNSLPNEIFHFS